MYQTKTARKERAAYTIIGRKTKTFDEAHEFVTGTKFRQIDLVNDTDILLQAMAQWAYCRGFTEAEVELTKIIQLLHTLKDEAAINEYEHQHD